MKFVVVGISHQTAPVELRERAVPKEGESSRVLQQISGRADIDECVMLATCNRIEIYAVGGDNAHDALARFLADRLSVSLARIETLSYVYENTEALVHLCMVCSGLKSMVLGEPQVFGQVKDAYQSAIATGTAGAVLDSLFSQVFSVVKKIRSGTGIGESTVSVSYVAVNLAKHLVGSLTGKTGMIIGAGEMGELTVRNLISNGLTKVYVTNRTFEKAVKLAETFHGTPVMFYERIEYMAQSDIVLSSITASEYVVTPLDMQRVTELRRGKMIIIIDISVPRTVDPRVGEIEGVHLYNIDDLRAESEANVAVRSKAAEKARQIIAAKAAGIMSSLDSKDIGTKIQSLKSTAEEIRRDEYDRLLARMVVSDADKNVIEAFSRSVVNKIVHKSIVTMREYVNSVRYH